MDATTTVTNIELHEIGILPSTSAAVSLRSKNGILWEPEEAVQRVVSAQAIDATIPDGGYGWIVIVACAVVSFWFVKTRLQEYAGRELEDREDLTPVR